MVRHITDAETDEIIRLYREGVGGPEIARRMQCGSTAVYQRLWAAGIRPAVAKHITMTPVRKTTPTQDQEIAALYGSGLTLATIGVRFGCTPGTVANILRRLGVSRRRTGGALRAFTDEQVADMVRLWQAGQSQSAIAHRYGIQQTMVSRTLLFHGIQPQTRHARGERHGLWKGGRKTTDKGYIYVRLGHDSPFASMRLGSGVVAEHRLVMAQHLGRPLLRSESVHHIDGNRAHNVIENLQLMQRTNHCPGASFRCADCGSTNIVSKYLDTT